MKNLLFKLSLVFLVILTICGMNYLIGLYNASADSNNKNLLMDLKIKTEDFFYNAFNLNSIIASEQSVKNCLLNFDARSNYQKKYSEKYDVSGPLAHNSGLEFFVDIQKKYPFIELIFLQDLDGRQRARSFGALGIRKDRWWFKRYFDKIYSPFISKSYYSKTGDIPVVSIFHTIMNDNVPIGVLGMDVNLKRLTQKFYDFCKYKEKVFFLIDNEGIIIAHPDTSTLSEIYSLKKLQKEGLIKDEKGGTFQELEGYHKTRNFLLNWDKRFIEITEKILSGGSGTYSGVLIEDKRYTVYFDKIKMPGEKFEGGGENFFGIVLLNPEPPFYFTLLLNGYFISTVLVFAFIILYFILKKYFMESALERFKAILIKNDINFKSADSIEKAAGEFEKILSENNKYRGFEESKLRNELANAGKIETLEKNIDLLNLDYFKLKNEIFQFKSALDNCMFAVAITGVNGNILYVNKSFEILTGYKSEEIIGKNPALLKTGSHSQIFYKEMWDTILSGKIWRGEIFNKRKSGDSYWEYMTITPLYDDKGDKILFFLAVKENITEKKSKQIEIENKRQTEIKFYKEQLEFVFRVLKEFKTVIEPVLKPDRKFNQKELDNLANIIGVNTSMINEMLEYSYKDLSVERLKEENFKASDELDKLKKFIGLKIKDDSISFNISYPAEFRGKIRGYFNCIYQAVIILTDFFLIHTKEGNIALSADIASETDNKIFIKFMLNWNIYSCNTAFISENCAANKTAEELNQYWHIFYVKKLLEIIGSELFVEKNNDNSYLFDFCAEFKKCVLEEGDRSSGRIEFETDDIKDRLLILENIDYSHGLRMVNNNIEVYCRILKMFYDRNEEHLKILENFSAVSPVKIREIIHTIKGSSANIGAEKLFISAKKILDKIEPVSNVEITEFIGELKTARASINKFLEAEANIIESRECEKINLPVNKNYCMEDMAKLLELLKNFNAESLPLFNNISLKYDFKDFEYEILSIRRLIFSYSFEECVVLVERFIEKLKLMNGGRV
ncbi:MAG TPA: PAS domain S-box protein [bacterium]|nr:PAS domain S-box protein [bacterium]